MAETDTGAMVFDEIDAGVSGVAAQRVGEKLARLAQDRQVLCVTHLPQIAVMADTQFEIQKSVSEGRTYTHVTELDFDGRKKEIARLSGGESITETTLASAAEQLATAEGYKKCIIHNSSQIECAGMAELADALDLGSSSHKSAGSTPVTRTIDHFSENIGIEPLPGIDFNLKAGNTLVGYTNEQEAANSYIVQYQLVFGFSQRCSLSIIK